jgi:hypothetical protein
MVAMASRKNRCFRPRHEPKTCVFPEKRPATRTEWPFRGHRECAYLGAWWSDTPVEVTLFCLKKRKNFKKEKNLL